MAEERRAVTIYYHKLVTHDDTELPLTLEAAIHTALAKQVDGVTLKSRWNLRCLVGSAPARDHLFINHIHDENKLVFGNLVSFTKGRAQALLRQLGDVPEVNIEQFDPPENDEFLDAILYWLVIKNHVFLIQAGALRSAEFEKYIQWLLAERSAVWPSNTHTFLIDEFDLAKDELQKRAPDVRMINIGGRAQSSDATTPAPEPGRERVRIERGEIAELAGSEEQGWVKGVLAAVLGNQERVNNALRRLPEGATLKVSVRLGYERTRRDIDRAELRNLLIAARNLPDSDLSAETKDGTKISGGKIRLTHPARVLLVGDLLDPNDAKRAMIEAYSVFVGNGKIDA
jgi:hypothetical protein